MANEPNEICVGNPDEWVRYATANPGLVDDAPNLIEMARRVFERRFDGSDMAIFSLGLMIWEDFEDIVILAGNGR